VPENPKLVPFLGQNHMFKTVLNTILTGIILLIVQASSYSQAGWPGSYSGHIEGAASTMTIQQNGNSISGNINSGGGDVTRGQWRTQNGVIYINEGYGWEAYSGHYVEGNSMLLKFDDGSKQLWERTY